MHATHTKLLHCLFCGVVQVRAFSATCLPYAVTIRSGKSRYHVEVTHYNPRCNPGSAKKEYVHSEPQLLREIPPSSVNASLGREAISLSSLPIITDYCLTEFLLHISTGAATSGASETVPPSLGHMARGPSALPPPRKTYITARSKWTRPRNLFPPRASLIDSRTFVIWISFPQQY